MIFLAQSSTQLCNLGLQRSQCGARLNSFDSDVSKEASQARDVYDTIRRAMLRESYWNFAKKRVQLAALATAPTYGLDYAYGYPADCLRIVSVHPYDSDVASIKYHLETVDVALTPTKAIVTNANQAYLLYVADVTSLALWDADFYDAFAWRLGAEFASNIKKSLAIAQWCMKNYYSTISLAKSSGGVDEWPTRQPDHFYGSWVSEHDSGSSDFDAGW